jgi:hypothetical protein
MNTKEMQERLYINKIAIGSKMYQRDFPSALSMHEVRKLDQRREEPQVRGKHREGFKPQMGFHIFAKQPELYAYMNTTGFRNRLRRPVDGIRRAVG